MNTRTLEIQLNPSDEDDSTIVSRVSELVDKGYTSGYEPTWEIRERETPTDETGETALREALERAEMFATQACIASNMGRKSHAKRADFLFRQFEQLGKEIRKTLDDTTPPPNALQDAARAVVDAWEGGDLAAAVRNLDKLTRTK